MISAFAAGGAAPPPVIPIYSSSRSIRCSWVAGTSPAMTTSIINQYLDWSGVPLADGAGFL